MQNILTSCQCCALTSYAQSTSFPTVRERADIVNDENWKLVPENFDFADAVFQDVHGPFEDVAYPNSNKEVGQIVSQEQTGAKETAVDEEDP